MSQRLTMAFLSMAFIVLGIAATLLGPTLNNLTQQFGMPLEDGGIFITIYSTGVTISLIIAGWIFNSGRIAPRYVIAAGALMLAIGLILLSATANFNVAVVAASIFGLGYGLLMISPNVMVSAMFREDVTARLNALNTFFGVGAIMGPQVVNLAFSLENYLFAYLLTAVAALVLIPFLLRIDLSAKVIAGDKTPASAEVKVNWLVFLPFAALLFAYVGGEVGFGAWIATHLRLVGGVSEETANIGVSLFWGGLTAGRALGAVLARTLNAMQLLMLSALVLVIGAILILGLPMFTVILFVASFIVGLGCGPIFPTTIALISDNYPRQFAAASGLIMAAGNVGPVIIPWLQGQIGGGEDGGMIVTLVCGLVMLSLIAIIARQVRNRQNAIELANAAL